MHMGKPYYFNFIFPQYLWNHTNGNIPDSSADFIMESERCFGKEVFEIAVMQKFMLNHIVSRYVQQQKSIHQAWNRTIVRISYGEVKKSPFGWAWTQVVSIYWEKIKC